MTRSARPDRFPARRYALLLAAILIVAALPVLSVLVASSVATSQGCVLHEGFANPCVIGGTDFGETLYAMGVMGWLMLVSIPFGAMALLVWAAILVIHLILWKRGKRGGLP